MDTGLHAAPRGKGVAVRFVAILFGSAVVLGTTVATAAAPGEVTISGKITYTGRTPSNAYGNFAVRFARVEVWDKNPGGTDVQVGTFTTTAADGTYSITVPTRETQPGQAGLFDPYIRVRTEAYASDGALLARVVNESPPPPAPPQARNVYSFNGPVRSDVGANTRMDVPMGSTTVPEQAFSVLDAMTAAASAHGSYATSSGVDAMFPRNSPGTTAYYGSDKVIRILAGDRYDWDVIDHEYAHYYAATHPGIAAAVGGHHDLDQNLRRERGIPDPDATRNDPVYNLRQADQLAWSEGLATWWGTGMQQTESLNTFGIQHVGDASYSDNKDGDGISAGTSYSLESATAGYPDVGQDNELSVQRILYDLADATNDAADHDRVSIGFDALLKFIVDHTTDTLGRFWDALVYGTSNQQHIDYGAIFEAHHVSPTPVSGPYSVMPAISGSVPPTFTWSIPQGTRADGSVGNLVNEWQLLFFAGSDYDLIFDSPLFGTLDPVNEQPLTAWQPTPEQWSFIAADPTLVHWIVTGRDTESIGGSPYVTGSYWSDALAFYVVPEPGVLVLVVGPLAALLWQRRRLALRGAQHSLANVSMRWRSLRSRA